MSQELGSVDDGFRAGYRGNNKYTKLPHKVVRKASNHRISAIQRCKLITESLDCRDSMISLLSLSEEPLLDYSCQLQMDLALLSSIHLPLLDPWHLQWMH